MWYVQLYLLEIENREYFQIWRGQESADEMYNGHFDLAELALITDI